MTALLEKEDMVHQQVSPTSKGPKGMNHGWSSSHMFGDQLRGHFFEGNQFVLSSRDDALQLQVL